MVRRRKGAAPGSCSLKMGLAQHGSPISPEGNQCPGEFPKPMESTSDKLPEGISDRLQKCSPMPNIRTEHDSFPEFDKAGKDYEHNL